MMQRFIPITSWAVIGAILVAAGFQGKPYLEDAAPQPEEKTSSQVGESHDAAAADASESDSKDQSGSKEQERPTGFGPIRAPVELVGRSMWSATSIHAKARGCDVPARLDRGGGIPHHHVLPPNGNGSHAVLLASVATAVRPHAPPA